MILVKKAGVFASAFFVDMRHCKNIVRISTAYR